MDVLFFFIAWAGMWVWVVRNRGAWSLPLANLLGAASGLMVGVVIEQLYVGLFGLPRPTVPSLMRTVLEMLSFAGAVIGVWMWVAHRSQTDHPLLRHLLAGLCGTAAGLTAIMFFAQFHPPKLGM